MLKELFNLVKEQSTDAIINNPEIPNSENDAVIASATHSVADGLQGSLASGGLQSVLSLFNNGSPTNSSNNGYGAGNGILSNPIVSNIISSFTNKLTNNHHIPGNQATGIASGLIPNVLSNLVNRTNDPNNSSFNLSSIINSLSGSNQNNGNGFDLGGMVSKFTSGLDVNNDGHVGLDDLVSKVTNGAKSQQQSQNKTSGGGLMDIIKGFIN